MDTRRCVGVSKGSAVTGVSAAGARTVANVARVCSDCIELAVMGRDTYLRES
jgi:hypothetical protein